MNIQNKDTKDTKDKNEKTEKTTQQQTRNKQNTPNTQNKQHKRIKRNIVSIRDTEHLPENIDVCVLNHFFDPQEKSAHSIVDLGAKRTSDRCVHISSLIDEIFPKMANGGLLFIYSLPKWLPFIGKLIEDTRDATSKFAFKYWIALDIDSSPQPQNSLHSSHMGLLMYLKTRDRKSPSPFHLNTKTVRIPYSTCKACHLNLKDWGGKKHLINPLGANISDVWKHCTKNPVDDRIIPPDILHFLYDLTAKTGEGKEAEEGEEAGENLREKFTFIHYLQENSPQEQPLHRFPFQIPTQVPPSLPMTDPPLETYPDYENTIVHGDSIAVLKKIAQEHPQGIFDLAFADPPYNLAKDYVRYDDEKKTQAYLEWCDEWIYWMSKTLKPGGALLILNLPKWALHHAVKLSQYMIFKNWIVWDAMSTPSGKIMPAHYALLYYVKPGGTPTFHFSGNPSHSMSLSPEVIRKDPTSIDAPYYCSRQKCVKTRKKAGHNDQIALTDVWWDIPRIKHRKYRDGMHPCQLPFKMMTRILSLFSNENDLILDPFSGTGTTALVAKMHRRKYFAIDLDKIYAEISTTNLQALVPTSDGSYDFPRTSVTMKHTRAITKKEIELGYFAVCTRARKILAFSELRQIKPDLADKIEKKQMNFKTLVKMARRRLEVEK